MQPEALLIADSDAGGVIGEVIAAVGWSLRTTEPGPAALLCALERRPHFIIVDARLADAKSTQICSSLRALEEMRAVPLIALGPPAQPEVRLKLLEAGVDECWTERPDSRECQLRLRAIARRLQPASPPHVLRQAGLELDLDRYTVRAQGAPVQLTAMQLKVLRHFMEHPGVILTCRELLHGVWDNPGLTEGAVKACVMRIRRALAAAGRPKAIRNVRTTGGYIFDSEAAEVRP